ncbi:hypothetical protein D7X48_19185 [bacterium D16-50]|nr:hypothetical protein D7X48_19185 [bacterium D16-50]
MHVLMSEKGRLKGRAAGPAVGRESKGRAAGPAAGRESKGRATGACSGEVVQGQSYGSLQRGGSPRAELRGPAAGR